MNLNAQVGRSAAWAIVGQGSIALLSIVNFAVVGRFVTPTEYGYFLFAMMVLTATQWLALNAYKEPLVQSPNITDGQINSVFTFSVAVGVSLCLAMCAVAYYFETIVESSVIALCVVILAIKLLLDTSMSVPSALRIRKLDFKFLARVAIFSNIIATAVNIGLLLGGFGLISLVLSQLAASAIASGAFFYYSQRRYFLKINFSDLTILKGYTEHVILWQALEAIGQTVDRYFIAAKLSLIDLGLYGFGKRLNDVIIEVLVGAASSVSLPAFSQLQHDRDRLQSAFLKAVRIVTLIVLPVIAALYVTADDFVPLFFGPKWSGAISVYRWFLLLGIIQTVGILQGGLLRSLWKPGVWTRYMLAQCTANVIVLSFVAGYGIDVLAAAIVIRAYVLWGWVVLQTCKALNLNFSFYVLQLLKPISIAIVAALVGFLMRDTFQIMNLFLRLLANGFVVVIIFSLLAFVFLRPAILEVSTLLRNIVSKKLAYSGE